MEAGCPGKPGYPARNSPERDSRWAMFWAAAKNNKQNGGQKKRFDGKLLIFSITRSASGRFSVSGVIILHTANWV